MPTFLVTREMSPALAKRVVASISGQRSAGQHARRRPLTALLRLAVFVLAVVSIGALIRHRHRTASELEANRRSLLRALRAQSSLLTPTERDLMKRVKSAIAAHSTPAYAGDWIADDLRSEPRLLEALGLPMLYVRGPLEGLARPDALAQLALGSGKDAFVLCLLDPPEARGEQALKAKARAADSRGKSLQLTANVERLAPLFQALPLLSGDWERRAKSAENGLILDGLRKLFDRAPVRAAIRAAKARQLLVVMDEPGDGKGPTELDGERPHWVRVILAELASGALRLRFRRPVDPSFISQNARAEYARGIDSCALAMDLRSAVLGQRSALASSTPSSAQCK